MENKDKTPKKALSEPLQQYKVVGSACPFGCGGKIIERTKKFKHVTEKGVFNGDWIVFQCDKCRQEFTTTKSDEISLNNLKYRKL